MLVVPCVGSDMEEEILAAAGGFDDGNLVQQRQEEAEKLREQLAQARSDDAMEIKFMNNGIRSSVWMEPEDSVMDLLDAIYEASGRTTSRLMFLTRKSQRQEMFPGCSQEELLALCAVSYLREKNQVRECMIDGLPVKDPETMTLAQFRQRLIRRTSRQAKYDL